AAYERGRREGDREEDRRDRRGRGHDDLRRARGAEMTPPERPRRCDQRRAGGRDDERRKPELPGVLGRETDSHVLSEGLRPSDSPTASLARRSAGSLRSAGSFAALARALTMSGAFITHLAAARGRAR